VVTNDVYFGWRTSPAGTALLSQKEHTVYLVGYLVEIYGRYFSVCTYPCCPLLLSYIMVGLRPGAHRTLRR